MDGDLDPVETAEYQVGVAWADRNLPKLVELYSSRELDTGELRVRLFHEAGGFYPHKRETNENDIRQTLWVMGAIRRLVDTLPGGRESMAAVFDAAMEMGAILSAERGTLAALNALKDRPAAWWRKKFGDATPNDLMKPIYRKWWHDVGFPENRTRTTKWEALLHVLGTREMWALADLEKVHYIGDELYKRYDVEGGENSFQMISEDVVHEGRIVEHAGSITG
jgi:hypothetical protein